MFPGIAKFLTTLYLAVYLAGGGMVCFHEMASWFSAGCHHHCCHEHDGDHDGHCDHCGDTISPESHCDCVLKPFSGELPSVLKLLEVASIPHFSDGTHAVETAHPELEYQARWKHPPPPLISKTSLPVLQRYNV